MNSKISLAFKKCKMENRPACKAGILIPKRQSSKKVVKNVKNILQT